MEEKSRMEPVSQNKTESADRNCSDRSVTRHHVCTQRNVFRYMETVIRKKISAYNSVSSTDRKVIPAETFGELR